MIESDQKAAALWLENRGLEPVGLQVRVMAWHQAEYDDHIEPQRRLVGSPPTVTIEPGKRQMIRLVTLEPVVPGSEQSYRVLVDEVLQPGAERDKRLGVTFQMRYSVPLFVFGNGVGLAGQEDAKKGIRMLEPKLAFSVQREGGRRFLVLDNQGAAHARLSGVYVRQGERLTSLAEGLLGYVLPGARMRWELPDAVVGDAFALEAKVNEQREPQSIPRH